MERKSILKKILLVLTAGALSLSLMFGIPVGELSLGITASAAEPYPEEITVDVSQGNITIGNDYTIKYGNGQSVGYNPYDVIKITGTTKANTITVEEGVSANITLSGVNIDVSRDKDKAAFMIADGSTGNVTITLADGTTNTLKSSDGCAGLQKNGSGANIGKLTIGGTGSLTATGGGNWGAGIGGGESGSSSNITISGGTVTAQGGTNAAGIGGGESGSSSNITISGGKVTATGGYDGAGIGGGKRGSCSYITISDNAEVTATGGYWGAGIGGGFNSSGSYITISGGKVTATGDHDGGAGIGGGKYSSASNIDISGGEVTAKGGSGSAGIGGSEYGSGSGITISGGDVEATGGNNGAGIGGGNNGSGSDITISGNAVVTATGGENAKGIGGGNGGSSDNFKFEGGKIIVAKDAEIPEGKSLTIPEGAVLEIKEGVTLTNSGTLTNNGTINNNGTSQNNGTINNNGAINGEGAISGSGTIIKAYKGDALNIANGSIVISDKTFKYGNETYTYTEDQQITITGSTNANTIKVEQNVSANITLSGVNIESTKAAFKIADGSKGNVTVTLADGTTNTLKSGNIAAGLQKNGAYISPDQGKLTIQGGELGTGILNTTGGNYAAGIGGGAAGSGTNITINGGTVNAAGGEGGAGIGGGVNVSGTNITINGGTVNATGGEGGAGIGGGYSGSGSNITIGGGTVIATGGNNAAGIGGGNGGSCTNFTFDGGKIIVAKNAEIPEGKTLTIPAEAVLEIKEGVTLTNNGTIQNNGTINNGGTISGSGTIISTNKGEPFNVADGSIIIGEGFIKQGNNVFNFTGTPAITITGTTKANTITVEEGVSANITLSGVNIESTSTAAFMIADNSTGYVTVTLADGTTNTLKSGGICAGLQKNGEGADIGKLTIGGTGSLEATGCYGSAGIGGGENGNGSNITISGGIITATGDNSGAGIGGGYCGNGSNITISGGTVTATGGDNAAGIGGGGGGNGSNITISGGEVEATGGYDGAGIGGGYGYTSGGTGSNITIDGGSVNATGGTNAAGIGGGDDGNGSNITIGGNAVVTATGGNGGAGIGGGNGGSSDNFQFEGGKIIVEHDSEIPGGYTLTIPEGAVLEIKEGVTLTNNGTIENNGTVTNNGTVNNNGTIENNGTLTNNNTVTNNGTIQNNGAINGEGNISGNGTIISTYKGEPLNVADGSIVIGENTITQGNKTYTYTEEQQITITGTTETNTITVEQDVSANITLSGVNIDVSSTENAAAFKIADDSTGNVTVTLADGTTNTLKSGNYAAGLQKNGSGADIGKLTIGGTGSLEATGGYNGAGIGGGNQGSGSYITISGGKVTATSSHGGAGIGGGYGGNGSNITISGGIITATGGDLGAGIGGGYGGSASNIDISGGEVEATGGINAAGIGGNGGNVTGITISGGDVEATGGDYAAGIGGGNQGSGSYITISGGTVTATGVYAAAGIGGGYQGSGSGITISDNAVVTAKGGYGGAGIGGGYNGNGSDITISGNAEVTATGGDYAAGIGGGDNGSGSDITISGGAVTAKSGIRAAGIGGGYNGNGSDITISGGSVKAVNNKIDNPTDSSGSPVYPLELDTNGNPVSITTAAGITYNAPSTHGESNNICVYLPAGAVDNTNNITLNAGTDSEDTLKRYYSVDKGKWITVKDVDAPENIKATYGNTLKDLTLPSDDTGKWVWSVEDINTPVGNVPDVNKFTAVYIFNDDSYESVPQSVTVKVNPKPITVLADAKSKIYGETDPKLTYTVDLNTPLVTGEKLSGELAREEGEDAGEYKITQGTLTSANNPNYDITFNKDTFTIQSAAVTDKTAAAQSVVAGFGSFQAPKFTDIKGEALSGTITYTYNGSTQTADDITAALAKLKEGESGTIGYTFTPESKNYKGASGSFNFTIIDIDFTAGGKAVTAENAVTIKENPIYGDSWEEIIKLNTLTATLGSDSTTSGFELVLTGEPTAGTHDFSVVFSGTLGGNKITDVVVVSGKLTISEKPVAAAPVISPNGGTFSGSQAVTITCATEGSDIYYTTDGTDPTAASTKYEGEFTVTKTETIKAIAVKDGMVNSAVVSAIFTINAVPTPVIPSGPTTPGRPATPTTPTTPAVSKNPIVNGKEQSWTDIIGEAKNIPNGGKLTIETNGNTLVPADLIAEIADKEAVVTIKTDDNISFVIDGSKLEDKISAIDLSVGKSKTSLSKTNFSKLGGTAEKQFTLGKIDIPVKMSFSLKKADAGKIASLMKLNSKKDKYEFVSDAKVEADGTALVEVDGEGDYLLIIDSESKKPEDLNNDMITNVLNAPEQLGGIIHKLSLNSFIIDGNGDGKIDMDASLVLKAAIGADTDSN